jgi:hypothetical protein
MEKSVEAWSRMVRSIGGIWDDDCDGVVLVCCVWCCCVDEDDGAVVWLFV